MRVLHQKKYTAYVASPSPKLGMGHVHITTSGVDGKLYATHQTQSRHCLYSGCNVLRWPRNISFVYSYHQITFVTYRKPTHEKQEKQDAKTRQQHHGRTNQSSIKKTLTLISTSISKLFSMMSRSTLSCHAKTTHANRSIRFDNIPTIDISKYVCMYIAATFTISTERRRLNTFDFRHTKKKTLTHEPA